MDRLLETNMSGEDGDNDDTDKGLDSDDPIDAEFEVRFVDLSGN